MNANQSTAGDAASRTDPASEHREAAACCGGPAPAGTSACCTQDAEVKSEGGAGCGCSSSPTPPQRTKTSCC